MISVTLHPHSNLHFEKFVPPTGRSQVPKQPVSEPGTPHFYKEYNIQLAYKLIVNIFLKHITKVFNLVLVTGSRQPGETKLGQLFILVG